MVLSSLKKLFSYKIEIPGYKFNNVIFRIAIGIIALVLIVASFQIKGNAYTKCYSPYGFQCENPFYNAKVCPYASASDCLIEFIPDGGTLGVSPGPLYGNLSLIVFGIMALAFIINHLLYNRGVRFEL